MSSDIAICVKNVTKTYQIYDKPQDRLKQSLWRGRKKFFREFKALDNISLEVNKGETVGIIGRNGSGKSTLLQIICGTLAPTAGTVEVNGRVAALLELGSGFNPEFTGRENVYMNASILGLSIEEIDAKYDEIIAFADIGSFVDQPVKTYSSGMVVRLAFAVAINADPELFVVDEALSVGDELFQRKCFSRIEAIRDAGATILFVSHSGGAIVELCDRAMLIDAGEKLTIGMPKQIVGRYQKLLYAPAEMHEAIRDQIRATEECTENSDGVVGREAEECITSSWLEQPLREWFDPDFKPSSTIEYESNGAHIESPRILALDCHQVNNLIHGKSYRFLYTVKFSGSAKNVRFSMLVKSVNGIELSGVGFPANNEEPIHIDSPCTASVEFLFACKLLPGTYYINAGCRGLIREEEKFLHRIVDAICFRVLPRENLEIRAGYFDFIEPVGCEIFSERRL